MSFAYLATPYSKYKDGLEAANIMASKHAATFIGKKVNVFCPIAHSHSISVYGDLQAKDHGVWMPLDFAFCEESYALIVVLEDGWKESYGVQEEIKFFQKRGKPIYYWEPGTDIDINFLQALRLDEACHDLNVKRAVV